MKRMLKIFPVLMIVVLAFSALPNGTAMADEPLPVVYTFTGFFSPIKMTEDNLVKAGRNIPVKWQLSLADLTPVTDPAAFVGVMTYAVDCETLIGDPTTAISEKSPGKSALKVNRNGSWKFNWKTPKAYAATCRMMYVLFDNGQMSPEVLFRFR